MQSAPPRKKRRLAMPEFKSSFNLSSCDGKSSGKNNKNLNGFELYNNFEEQNLPEKTFARAKHVVTPIKTPRVVNPAFNHASNVVSPSVEYVKRSKHLSFTSDTFIGLSSTFGVDIPRVKTPKTFLPNATAKNQHEGGPRLSTRPPEPFRSNINDAAQTPRRVFAPLRLQESNPPNSRSHLKNIVTPIPLKPNKADAENDISLASRLSLQHDLDFESPIKSKIQGLISPNVPAPPSNFNRERLIAFSKLSHFERAERLVQPTHESPRNAPTKTYPDLMRGMDVSPHKDISGKRNLVSGGFAERVQRLLSRSQTDAVLWETEHSKDRLKPSKGVISLRVLSIVSSTYSPSALTQQPTFPINSRAILARCSSLEGSSTCAVLAVFLFPPNKSSVGLEAGKKVQVWRPWHEINIPPDDGATPTTALLCSRFLTVS